MRFHLLGLPHTQVTADYLTCAYTQKVRKFVQAMSKDHEVILYSGGETDVKPTEHIQCGRPLHYFPGGYDPVTMPLRWEPDEPCWADFIADAQPALEANVEQGDLVLSTVSTDNYCMTPSVAARAINVEWMVGYEKVLAPFAFFESYAWMHHCYGAMGINNGRSFDDVVSGWFDPKDFHVGSDEGYLLYLGRMCERKGVHVASQIAERLDLPIIFAGPGASTPGIGRFPHEIVCSDGTPATGIYKGAVGVEERAQLLAGASCLIVPTLYIEPFGGVSIEALMSGVPVVASDWGVFTETITPELGRRFRTLQEGCEAVEAVRGLRRPRLRARAIDRWSLKSVKPRFEHAFERLNTLWGKGWDA